MAFSPGDILICVALAHLVTKARLGRVPAALLVEGDNLLGWTEELGGLQSMGSLRVEIGRAHV